MQPKWTYFTIGVMAGIIAVLMTVLVMQPKDSYAQPDPSKPAQSSGDGSIIVGTGGASQSQNDIVWVLQKHTPKIKKEPKPGEKEDPLQSGPHLTLCCYQVTRNGDRMKLVGARDITYDMEIVELNNEKPSVREIVKELKVQDK